MQTSWTKVHDSLEGEELRVACTQCGAGEAEPPGSQQGRKEGQGRGEGEAWRRRRSLFPSCPRATGDTPTLRNSLLLALGPASGGSVPISPKSLRADGALTRGWMVALWEGLGWFLACLSPWSERRNTKAHSGKAVPRIPFHPPSHGPLPPPQSEK